MERILKATSYNLEKYKSVCKKCKEMREEKHPETKDEIGACAWQSFDSEMCSNIDEKAKAYGITVV